MSYACVFFASAVKAKVDARKVTITGPRGSVSKDFSHVACEIKLMKQAEKKRTGNFIRIRIWFGGYKQSCAVNTLKSHISNMITGVTEVSGQYRSSQPFGRSFCGWLSSFLFY